VEEGQVSACGVPCFARNVDELVAGLGQNYLWEYEILIVQLI
jgi:hypothetical protein